jgi:hypothetical protein
MSESVILCEGYHDRAFWAGWLLYLGCTDPGKPTPGHVKRKTVNDPWNDPVIGSGQFAFLSQSGRFLRIQPCQGRTNILPAANRRLAQRTSRAITLLVMNIDADTHADGTSVATGLRQQDVLQFILNLDPGAFLNAAGEIEIDGGATKVALVRWEASDPHVRGLPPQQTLERLVCAALVAAYPPRAKPIEDWLASRPAPPAPDPKEHAWSHMAGWYAEHGCESFFSNLWNDLRIVSELETRLRACGAWRIAEALAS